MLSPSAGFVKALAKLHPGPGELLRRPGMTTAHVQDAGAAVAVTFSQIGRPRTITAPTTYKTVGGKD
ncbi:MAG TPA: hypothetical protein VK817_22540 [Trebonia sp.]|nr:hypothetical protein [Trebonia sp.]